MWPVREGQDCCPCTGGAAMQVSLEQGAESPEYLRGHG